MRCSGHRRGTARATSPSRPPWRAEPGSARHDGRHHSTDVQQGKSDDVPASVPPGFQNRADPQILRCDWQKLAAGAIVPTSPKAFWPCNEPKRFHGLSDFRKAKKSSSCLAIKQKKSPKGPARWRSRRRCSAPSIPMRRGASATLLDCFKRKVILREHGRYRSAR
jgi:hypothetical protein